MKSSDIIRAASVIAIVALAAGCSSMDRQEKGTAIGATSGAVAGAVVGGPIGAVVGGAAGGYVGHEGTEPGPSRSARSASSSSAYDASLVRSVQQTLNDRGYNAGPVDGVWGAGTESALRDFQQSNGLPQSGNLDRQTRAALGVSQSSVASSANGPTPSSPAPR